MNYLDSISLKNLIVFDKIKFDIKEGLSVIRGQNFDSKTKETSGNAVGKSLLFSSLSNVILHSPPMAEKKNSANSFLPDKGCIKLKMRLKQGATDIEQYATGKTIKYNVTIDGKKQKIRTPTQMRQEVSKLLPMSESIFYSTVMVSSFRPPLLWLGTSAQRYDFFEDIAELGYYDIMAAKISKKISEIKIQAKVIEPWAAELEDLKQIYTGKKQLRELCKQIGFLKSARQDLRKHYCQNQRNYDKFSNLSSDEAAAIKYGKFSTPKAAIKYYEKLKATGEDLAKYGQTLSAEIKDFDAKLTVYKSYKKWQKQLKRLPTDNIKEVQSKVRKLEQCISELQESQYIVDSMQEEADFYRDKNLAKLSGPKPNKRAIERLQAEINFYTHQQQLLKIWHDTGECPLCKSRGRKANGLAQKDNRKQLAHMGLLEAKYLFEENTKYHNAVKHVAKLGQYTKQLRKAKSLLELCSKRQTLLEHPVKKSKKVTSDNHAQKLTQHLKEVRTKFERLRNQTKTFENKYLRGYQELAVRFDKDVKLTELDAKEKKYRKKYEASQNDVDKIDNELISLRTQLQSVKLARKSYNKLNKKYNAALKVQEDLVDWQILHKVFGPIGMRIAHMQTLVNSYVNYLNNMANLVYSEPVVFSSRLEGRNFDLLVTRHGKSSDVRYLSGAQSRFFMALSAVALRKMLPASKQFNILILDEIDAGVSTGEMAKFTNDFLPFINEEVPSIFIITPKTREEWFIPHANDFVFTRKDGKTTINTQQQLQLVA